MIKSSKLIGKPKPLFRIEDCSIMDGVERVAICNLNLYGKDISKGRVVEIENPRVTIEMMGEERDTENPDVEDHLISKYQDEHEGNLVDEIIDRRNERDAA